MKSLYKVQVYITHVYYTCILHMYITHVHYTCILHMFRITLLVLGRKGNGYNYIYICAADICTPVTYILHICVSNSNTITALGD